jgi:flagellar biosynthesis protein FlhA
VLTVGDGLASQVPALIVSTAAGHPRLQGRRHRRSADKALDASQLANYPQALGMSAGVMLVLIALLPGMPMLPFLALGGAAGAGLDRIASRRGLRRRPKQPRGGHAAPPPPAAPQRRPEETDRRRCSRSTTSSSRSATRCSPLVNGDGHRPAHRADQGAAPLSSRSETRHRDARGAHPRQRQSRGQHLRGARSRRVEAGTGKILAEPVHGRWTPMGNQVQLPGGHTCSSRPSACPRPGSMPACVIRRQLKGYTVVDAATVLSTHLTELIKANMSRSCCPMARFRSS